MMMMMMMEAEEEEGDIKGNSLGSPLLCRKQLAQLLGAQLVFLAWLHGL